MRDQTISKMLVPLLALCCLAPLAALGAILFLNAPVWPASLMALFIVGLLARRLFALLSTPVSDASRSPGNFPLEEGLSNHDHRQH